MSSAAGIIFVYLWVVAFCITATMDKIAKHIPINLFRTSQLTQLANPFLRGLLMLMVILSLMIYSTTLSNSQSVTTNIALPAVAVTSILAMVFIKPLLTLKIRIQHIKRSELACVEAAIAGEEPALKESLAYHQLKDASYTERLNYRQHVQAVWDWPLHEHIQKILFYVVIPPATWALSALVAKAIG
jgi:hypothetical protein